MIEDNISKIKKYLEFKDPNFRKFFLTQINGFTLLTQFNYLTTLKLFFGTINKYSDIEEEDILNFIESEWFNSLNNSSKNTTISRIRKYLISLERKDLADLLKYNNVKERELNKNDLISREDLENILNICRIKQKTLIMVNYEGALRNGELINIRFKDIQFNGGYANLYIQTSKTKKRNIPLVESISYLREFFLTEQFKPNDKIFPYTSMGINSTYRYILTRFKRKYPNFEKKLYPHILRHSRLTELANNRLLNESQLRKFAGWSPGSAMPKIYFHLDDTDIINVLTEGEITRPKPKKFKPKICDICDSENNQQNVYCWKCGNVFDKPKFLTKKIGEQDRIEEMSKKIDKLEKIYEIFAASMSKKE